jgi:hypothetical protein
MKRLRALRLLLIVSLSGLAMAATAAPCPPEGKGGDPLANLQKNRDTEPMSYQEMDVPQFLARHTPNLHTPRNRAHFAAPQQQGIEPGELEGIAVSGYLLMARKAKADSANCGDKKRRNFSLWIAKIPETHKKLAKVERTQAIVAELTPPWQARHPGWSLRALEKLAKQGAKVRVSGWAYYDAEHPEELGKTQATLWELHPVTRIEVWNSDHWQEL